LPTIAEEVADNHDLQANSERNGPPITSHTQASSLTANRVLSDELQEYPFSPVAWQTVIEQDAVKRHHVSHDRFLDYKARVYPSGYSGSGWDVRYEWLWSCVSNNEASHHLDH